jgi:hypothetical protein
MHAIDDWGCSKAIFTSKPVFHRIVSPFALLVISLVPVRAQPESDAEVARIDQRREVGWPVPRSATSKDLPFQKICRFKRPAASRRRCR